MSTETEASRQVESIQSDLLEGIKQNAGWAIAIGVISTIAGFLALWAPFIAGLSVTVVVGLLLIATGVSQLIFAFKTGSIGKGLMTFVLGALAVVAGLYMALRPGVGLLSLTLVLAAYFFVAGITEIIGAFKMKRAKGWVWALLSGVASLALGVMIWWQFPLSADWAVGILTGIRMVFGGWWLIAIGNGFRTAAKAEEAAPA
jgi:uncharacterized membrane protein HdeD (DUF308 family)